MLISATCRKLLASALSLAVLACAFTFDAGGVARFWSGEPCVAVALLVGVGVALAVALAGGRRSRDHA